MYRITALLAVLAIGLAGCDGTDEGQELVIHYDGPNQSAPSLGDGAQQAAVRFTPAQIGGVAGGTLEAVNVYIRNVPNAAELRIYRESRPTEPGTLVYRQPVGDLQPDSWNLIQLDQTVGLLDEDLWVGFAYTIDASLAVVGCDPGPAVRDGDWTFNAENGWAPFNQISPESINWNIRAVVRTP
ncbi:MAG: hypothetical protein AAF752_06705 [Bacteroidota bacterium]